MDNDELSPVWNPSLRKTVSAPPVAHNKLSRKHSRPGLLQGFRNSITRRWSDSDPPGRPQIISKPSDISTSIGSKAIIECKIEPCLTELYVTWRKIEPKLIVLRPSDRIQITNQNNKATLIIKNCKETDSGVYQCTIANDIGSTQFSVTIKVTPSLLHLQAEVITCSSVILSYPELDSSHWHVEYCEAGTALWQTAIATPRVGCCLVEHLIPGTSYTFRINSGQPSAAVALPPADSSRRAQEQFHRRYAEGDELGRGRYSIVKAATDRGTGQLVALKQSWRARRSKSSTHSEYSLLSSTEHCNLLRALAMFEHAPRPGMDTIVMELIRGPLILEYLCRSTEYTESIVACLSKQIASGLFWLHSRTIAHCDLRPENIIVDNTSSQPNVKIIDFGAAVGLAEAPACIECTAPESIAALRNINNDNKSDPCAKDVWSFGVLIYIMLSGLSPFLDDSDEETTTNILKCDYCFPENYFAGIREEAIILLRKILVLQPENRILIGDCLESPWLQTDFGNCVIPSSRLLAFIERRRPTSRIPTSPLHNMTLNDN